MKAPDLLRRFTPTPLQADLSLLGRAIHLETNSARILEQARRALTGQGQPPSEGADFRWRLVSESSDQSRVVPSHATVVADQGLLFVNLDRRGFIAVDRKKCEAFGFLDDSLGDSFLPSLVSVLTACALGVTMVSAACLAYDNRGLLILGPLEATGSFRDQAAGRLGLRIHARRTVFMQARRSNLQVWGEFPMQGNLSERPVLTNHPSGLPNPAAQMVNLVACIWIDRQSFSGSFAEFQGVVFEFQPTVLFSGTGSSAFESRSLRQQFHQLPQCDFRSSDDPAQAIQFAEQVLVRGNLPEALP